MRAISLIAVSAFGLVLGLAACGGSSSGGDPGPDESGGSGGTGGTGGDGGGGEGGDGTGGNGGDDECTAITFGDPEVKYDFMGGYFVVNADISPNILGAGPDILQIVIASEDSGTIVLNSDPECDHCVYAGTDYDGEQWGKVFRHQSGTLQLNSTVDDLFNELIDATLTNVKLVEVDSKDKPVADGACLMITTGKLKVEPIEGWDCPLSYFNDGEYCDCECGNWDPDCDVAGTELWGCDLVGATCEKVSGGKSECKGGLADWSCPAEYYNDGDCDCNCGAWDVDCDSATDATWGCVPGHACIKGAGDKPACEDDAVWNCNPAAYGDGEACHCECGNWDPDCDNPALSTAYCQSGHACEKNAEEIGVCEDGAFWLCDPKYFND
ncbi:MAG: hypothetical protein FWD57_12650, partial [Polyangiaceae bacterium]|nr:hypothetical protein [Polyangiaceae bacterium]